MTTHHIPIVHSEVDHIEWPKTPVEPPASLEQRSEVDLIEWPKGSTEQIQHKIEIDYSIGGKKQVCTLTQKLLFYLIISTSIQLVASRPMAASSRLP